MVGPESVLRRPIDLRIRRFRGKLLVSRREETVELEDSSALLFRGVDGVCSVNDLAALLVEEYGIDHELALADTVEFIQELVDGGFVEVGG